MDNKFGISVVAMDTVKGLNLGVFYGRNHSENMNAAMAKKMGVEAGELEAALSEVEEGIHSTVIATKTNTISLSIEESMNATLTEQDREKRYYLVDVSVVLNEADTVQEQIVVDVDPAIDYEWEVDAEEDLGGKALFERFGIKPEDELAHGRYEFGDFVVAVTKMRFISAAQKKIIDLAQSI